jgi:hypothetical protein
MVAVVEVWDKQELQQHSQMWLTMLVVQQDMENMDGTHYQVQDMHNGLVTRHLVQRINMKKEIVNKFAEEFNTKFGTRAAGFFLFSGMYNLDTKKFDSYLYQSSDFTTLIKISNDVVTEYYKRSEDIKNYVSYDIDTNEPKEYYSSEGNLEIKRDYNTHAVMQENTFCLPHEVPEEFTSLIESNDEVKQCKNRVGLYATKPYGRIVEIYMYDHIDIHNAHNGITAELPKSRILTPEESAASVPPEAIIVKPKKKKTTKKNGKV